MNRRVFPRQQQTLDFIRSYTKKHGRGPELNEVAKHLRVHKATAWQHVEALWKHGYVVPNSSPIELVPGWTKHAPVIAGYYFIQAEVVSCVRLVRAAGDVLMAPEIDGCPKAASLDCLWWPIRVTEPPLATRDRRAKE